MMGQLCWHDISPESENPCKGRGKLANVFTILPVKTLEELGYHPNAQIRSQKIVTRNGTINAPISAAKPKIIMLSRSLKSGSENTRLNDNALKKGEAFVEFLNKLLIAIAPG